MSTYEVKIRQITLIEPHPNADKLELVAIGGYRAVVQKGIHSVGDLILYIPDDSVFTNLDIAVLLKVDSYLTGKQKNRVKAIKLRGIVSQGIVLPLSVLRDNYYALYHSLVDARKEAAKESGIIVWIDPLAMGYTEGTDWAETLRLIKYEEPIPMQMAGKVRRWPDFLPHYDLENIKRPESMNALVPGEAVVGTEKLHGTNMTVAIGPGLEEDEKVFVCSRNNAIKEDDTNVYWRAARKYELSRKVETLRLAMSVARGVEVENVSLHGEVVGVQDLKYGYENGDVGFYAFDIRVDGQYVDHHVFVDLCNSYDIPMVPLVYSGPYDYDVVRSLANGKTTIPGSTDILEGVVVRPVKERDDLFAGRVVFKIISDDYLTRKGGSELH